MRVVKIAVMMLVYLMQAATGEVSFETADCLIYYAP